MPPRVDGLLLASLRPALPPGGVQTAQGSCSGIPQCDSCLQSPDQSSFVCCCDTECLNWNPATPNQPPGFLGCCTDYQQVCAAAAG
jgi:hypothetical protein